MSCGVGHRYGLEPALLWLWHRPATTTLIQPLAWGTYIFSKCGHKEQKKKDFVDVSRIITKVLMKEN